MKRGYTGVIDNEFVFVTAKNKEEAKSILRIKAQGKDWGFDESRHYKIL